MVAMSYPAQGHVGPLMKLSQQIADHGIRVTFVTAQCIHALVLSTFQKEDDQNHIEKWQSQMELIQKMIIKIEEGLQSPCQVSCLKTLKI